MPFIPTPIPDLLMIEVPVFRDHRGLFFESFNRRIFDQAGIAVEFVQDNQSVSNRGVIRGLHFQLPPHAQGKLVRVAYGSVLDVAVDLRKSSPFFGRHFSVKLTGENNLMLWIPEGFAHGFLSLEDHTIFQYKCTSFYCKEAEACLLWNDPLLHIAWGQENPTVSEKDQEGLFFESFSSPF